MTNKAKKLYIQKRKRYLKRIVGTANKPRISIFRSNKHIYAQIINDSLGKTLLAINTLQKDKINNKSKEKPLKVSFNIGQILGQEALKLNVTEAVFDRNRYIYHGRVKSLAEGARNAGLNF